jgi:hypothetical protein
MGVKKQNSPIKLTRFGSLIEKIYLSLQADYGKGEQLNN